MAEAALDQFELRAGVRPNSRPRCESDALYFLDLTLDERRKLTPDQLFEAEYCLLRYAEYLSRLHDQQAAKALVAKETISRLVMAAVDRQTGYAFEERRLKAINADPRAVEVDRQRVEAEARKQRLASAAKWVGDTARSFGQAASSRNRNKGFQ